MQDKFPDIGYSFRVSDVEDVRHVLISAAGVALANLDQNTHTVLTAQAEMISKGLHIRDLDAIPDFMGDIERFHQHFGQEYLGKPRVLPNDLFNFRTRFHEEEETEYRDEQPGLELALASDDSKAVVNGLEIQLDSLVDHVYVVLGTAYLQFGAKVFNEAWRRVHEANMKKVRCERDEDSKRGDGAKFDIIKPEGWTPPRHHDLVENYEGRVFRKEGELNPGKTVQDGHAPAA